MTQDHAKQDVAFPGPLYSALTPNRRNDKEN